MVLFLHSIVDLFFNVENNQTHNHPHTSGSERVLEEREKSWISGSQNQTSRFELAREKVLLDQAI
jgi:hypothetical protein